MPSKRDRKCRLCPAMIDRQNTTGLCMSCFHAERRATTPSARVTADRDKQRIAAEIASLKAKYDESLKTIERQERALRVMNAIGDGIDTFTIEPREGHSHSEATAVLVASDWHAEERVNPGSISGLNEFDPDIAKIRATKFFQSGLRLIRLLQQDVSITNVVLALLGDFISNDIHEEFPEVNAMPPMHALMFAQSLICSGIKFLLDNSKVQLIIPCHSGNHARTTRTTRFSTENGHSLEYLMYLHLATEFKGEPRVQFIIPEGPHSYLDVYGQTIRFQHGHMVKYGGGVGGIYIPVNKAIAQWSKARHADLDVFGHFHQLRDGGNFICNGSLIGYNAFALSIKADYEPPKQALFLMDKKRGRTCTWPILVK